MFTIIALATHHDLRRGCLWLVAILLVLIVESLAAEPFVPDDDGQVLETLPRAVLVERNEVAELRQQLVATPENDELAANVAARYLQMGKAGGEPRFYGYARAVLRRWWDATDAPPKILQLRAKLKERDHQYDEAIADLKLLLKQKPQDAQAWIELANIYRVQGNYVEAGQACESLSRFAGPLAQVLCSAPINAATGHAAQAYQELADILPVAETQAPTAVQWITTVQTEIALALGRHEVAEKHLRDGLAADPNDQYLLRAYADFLLDRARHDEVLPLVSEHTNDTGILVRAAIAARRSNQLELASQWQEQLERRFDEIRLRGSEPHGRYEARCALELQNDPHRALQIGLDNWHKQKQARDTRNVLEAAIAANDPVAVQPVLDFLGEHGTEDVVLQKLVRHLERIP